MYFMQNGNGAVFKIASELLQPLLARLAFVNHHKAEEADSWLPIADDSHPQLNAGADLLIMWLSV